MGAAAAAPAAATAAAVPLQQLLQQPAQAASQRQRPPQQPAQAAPQAASGRQQRVAAGSRASGASNAQLGLVLWGGEGGISTATTALAFVSLACLRARRPAGMTQLRGRGPGDVHGHDHGDGHRHGLEPAQGHTKFSTVCIHIAYRITRQKRGSLLLFRCKYPNTINST